VAKVLKKAKKKSSKKAVKGEGFFRINVEREPTGIRVKVKKDKDLAESVKNAATDYASYSVRANGRRRNVELQVPQSATEMLRRYPWLTVAFHEEVETNSLVSQPESAEKLQKGLEEMQIWVTTWYENWMRPVNVELVLRIAKEGSKVEAENGL